VNRTFPEALCAAICCATVFYGELSYSEQAACPEARITQKEADAISLTAFSRYAKYHNRASLRGAIGFSHIFSMQEKLHSGRKTERAPPRIFPHPFIWSECL
jgi:hypothetical protein